MTKGRILSIESMGLVDGPGIRTVIFFQGCALRCLFCHNPDSWDMQSGKIVTSNELIQKILRFRPYFERSGGGVTFSGGEPLLQPDFLIDMLRQCKQNNIHTCLDTAGVGVGKYDEILPLCDLVLYDVKATDEEAYKKMCSIDFGKTSEFVKALQTHKPATIIRQVVVPGISDSDEYMTKLKTYIEKNLPFAEGVELLPYHRLGEHKYAKLGIKPPLGDIEAMNKEKTDELWRRFFKDFTKGEGRI